MRPYLVHCTLLPGSRGIKAFPRGIGYKFCTLLRSLYFIWSHLMVCSLYCDVIMTEGLGLVGPRQADSQCGTRFPHTLSFGTETRPFLCADGTKYVLLSIVVFVYCCWHHDVQLYLTCAWNKFPLGDNKVNLISSLSSHIQYIYCMLYILCIHIYTVYTVWVYIYII